MDQAIIFCTRMQMYHKRKQGRRKHTQKSLTSNRNLHKEHTYYQWIKRWAAEQDNNNCRHMTIALKVRQSNVLKKKKNFSELGLGGKQSVCKEVLQKQTWRHSMMAKLCMVTWNKLRFERISHSSAPSSWQEQHIPLTVALIYF